MCNETRFETFSEQGNFQKYTFTSFFHAILKKNSKEILMPTLVAILGVVVIVYFSFHGTFIAQYLKLGKYCPIN